MSIFFQVSILAVVGIAAIALAVYFKVGVVKDGDNSGE